VLVGIDISSTRGHDVAALDENRHLTLLAKARDLDALAVVARGLPPESLIAIDAPPAPSKGLVAGKRYRVAEEELHRLGVSVYPTPPSEDDAASWMREGFAVFELFAKMGFETFLSGAARTGVAFEVYPHLTYRILAGERRGQATKLAWSRQAIGRRVAGLPKAATQDQLDAVAAALTAWYFAADRWIGYGDPSEGVIIAPAEPGLSAARSAIDQLSLDIDPSSPLPRRASEPRETPFAARVLRLAAQIPPGRVATYGDIARACGKPMGARAVGTLLARHSFEVPSHRVVDANGRPSLAYPGGSDAQLARLAAEGVPTTAGRVNLPACRWSGPA
jgi:methylated-DNA-protein-cysteine methyltransferase related protein